MQPSVLTILRKPGAKPENKSRCHRCTTTNRAPPMCFFLCTTATRRCYRAHASSQPKQAIAGECAFYYLAHTRKPRWIP